jgi:hypothetical protein
LRPSGFIDVDAQKFDFSDVEWFRLPNEDELKLEDEIKAVEARGHRPPTSLRKLQKACRQLMNNAEENHDYPTANEFHYWSMELLRKESWWRRLGLIGSLYWALSGYGERPRRAFLVLVGVWALFALLFMVAGHKDLRVFSPSEVRYFAEHILTILARFTLNMPLAFSPYPETNILEKMSWAQAR